MSRTMVVEDDPLSGTALCRLLQATGHVSSLVTTLSAAVRQLDQHPDHVILDLMLPDGNGLRLLRQIRAEQLPIKVAITTATYDVNLLTQIQELEPEVIFRKPVNVPAILEWLESN